MKRFALLLAALVFLVITSAPKFGFAEESSHEGEYRENQHEKHKVEKSHKKIHKYHKKIHKESKKRHEEEHRD